MKISLESKGFTLIEVLVSIVVLSISLLALAGLMATTTHNTSFGGHITEATTVAQDKLEQLRVTPWDIIANGTSMAPQSVTGIRYNRTLNVVTNGDLKTVTITISWDDRGMTRSFNLVSGIIR